MIKISIFLADYALSQHSFIKSLNISPTVESWTNLGALYFTTESEDGITLAHEAFSHAQALDPGYVACWVGQVNMFLTMDIKVFNIILFLGHSG